MYERKKKRASEKEENWKITEMPMNKEETERRPREHMEARKGQNVREQTRKVAEPKNMRKQQ